MNLVKLNLLNDFKSVFMQQCRFRYKHWKKKPPSYLNGKREWTGGIDYYGFTYYPRYPDEKEPEVEPSKLFMVERIKKYSGNSWRLKLILDEFGLGKKEKMTKRVIIKNDALMNKKLWKIKHLIKVTPIKFVDGEPTADDINHCNINEWGELTIAKTIDLKRLEESDKFFSDPLHLDTETKKKDSRLKWLNPFN